MEILVIIAMPTVIISIAIVYAIIHNPNRPKKETITRLFLTPRPIRTENVVVYGHSASGKSTFIQRTFTAGKTELISTIKFGYYEFEKKVDMDKDDKVLLRIVDYRGQSPEQLVNNLAKTKVNVILFFVDVAPAYNSAGVKFREEELINFMANNDYQKVILDRVQEHEQYLSKFVLRLVLGSLRSRSLKSIYLLINKIDILYELQKRNIIEKDVDIESYARAFFVDIERELNKFCSANRIKDFKTFCISSTEYHNLLLISNELINN